MPSSGRTRLGRPETKAKESSGPPGCPLGVLLRFVFPFHIPRLANTVLELFP